MEDFIPVNEPVLSIEAEENVNEALSSGWLSSSGPFVKQFEEEFASYIGTKYAVAVSSGTAALHVALLSLGIGKGDEVIVPAFTMGACWLAVLYTGAKPVFVDCDPVNFCIDPSKITEKITKITKAIMPVHVYGHPADMDPIISIAKQHKLKIIEDAAEAHGATYKSKKCGSFGDVSCFSFYANKIISTGEGGMILTNSKRIAKRSERFRNLCHSDKKRFIHDDIGYNYRMTNLQAGIGCGELVHIDEYILKKKYMASLYNLLLKGVPGLVLPKVSKDTSDVYWMYAILVDEQKFGISRDNLREELKKKGVDTRDFFYAPKDQITLKKYPVDVNGFKNTENISHTGLYLPSGLAITDTQMKQVAMAIKEIQEATSS